MAAEYAPASRDEVQYILGGCGARAIVASEAMAGGRAFEYHNGPHKTASVTNDRGLEDAGRHRCERLLRERYREGHGSPVS